MKVLIVTTWLPTAAAPESGIFVERDIDLLVRDHDVRVLHLSAAAEQPIDGSSFARSHSWPVTTRRMVPANPLSVAAAAKMIRTQIPGYELVHTMAPSALLPFRRLVVDKPWVHTEHWSGILAPRTLPLIARLALPSTMRSLARPDVVVAVGERLAEAILRSRSGPVIVIPNAVTRPDVLVERRRNPSGRLRLVGVGGLIPRKGPELAVQALAELVARGMDAELTWVGDGPLRPQIAELAARIQVSDRVTLLGVLEQPAVLRELGNADVFILPTTGETFGVSIAEALASGRPVVVGADGGHAEFVHEPDGILVNDQTPTAYADAVARLVELNRSRSAENVAQFVTERFTDERRRQLYADAYSAAETTAKKRS